MTTMTQWLFNRIDSHRNRSRLQRLSRVFPMNVSQDGPLFPEAGRSYLESTLRTTSLSICTPKTLEIKSAIRGQPYRGFLHFVSTIARMSSSEGPFGPGFFFLRDAN